MSGQRTIGVVEGDLGGLYYRSVLLGIHAVARAQGVQCIALQGSLQSLHASQLALSNIDGLIAVLPTEEVKNLPRSENPPQTIDASFPELGCPAVLSDNHGGMAAATRHLLDHGHERVGFVGYLAQSDIQLRLAGYQAALAERGVPFEPELVFAASDNIERGGYAAGQRFLEAGALCTALVVATDLNAVGLMEALQAAGRRIPVDVAIIGFDNIATAQYTSPPLATVSQQFDALGRAAAQLLLEQIAGREVPAGVTHTPTTFIPRASCGCSSVQVALPLTSDADYTTSNWQDTLAQEMVRIARYPQPVASDAPGLNIWTSKAALIQGLYAALEGMPAPSDSELERAWQNVGALTTEVVNLRAIWKLLEHAGAQRSVALPADTERQGRLTAFLDQAALEMMRAKGKVNLTQRSYLERLVQVNYHVSNRVLAEALESTHQLAWLGEFGVRWGCLGLWDEAGSDTPRARSSAACGNWPCSVERALQLFRSTTAIEALHSTVSQRTARPIARPRPAFPCLAASDKGRRLAPRPQSARRRLVHSPLARQPLPPAHR
jgi:DNA-binding LacI/PurR family transcriptional regulator